MKYNTFKSVLLKQIYSSDKDKKYIFYTYMKKLVLLIEKNKSINNIF